MWLLIIAIIAGALAVIIRPFVTFAKFAYPNAKFESIGNPFVKETNLNRYLEITDLQQFIDQLNNQKDYQITGETASQIQTELDHQLVDTIHMMKNDSTKKMQSFYETYLELIDANLLKTALKQFIQQQETDETLIDQAVSPRITQHLKIITHAEADQLVSVLKQLEYPEYIISLLTTESNELSSFALDAAIDKMMITQLQQVKVPFKCTEAKKIFLKRLIDIRTIKHILRAKHLAYESEQCEQLLIGEGYELANWKQKDLCASENVTDLIAKLEGTKYYQSLRRTQETISKTDGSVQAYTDALEVLWLDIVKNISTSFYSSIGPSLRFLEYKQQEIRNLKIITKGIAERLPSSMISDLLITEAAS